MYNQRADIKQYLKQQLVGITPATQSAAAPTKAEYDALVAKFNAVLAVLQSGK